MGSICGKNLQIKKQPRLVCEVCEGYIEFGEREGYFIARWILNEYASKGPSENDGNYYIVYKGRRMYARSKSKETRKKYKPVFGTKFHTKEYLSAH